MEPARNASLICAAARQHTSTLDSTQSAFFARTMKRFLTYPLRKFRPTKMHVTTAKKHRRLMLRMPILLMPALSPLTEPMVCHT